MISAVSIFALENGMQNTIAKGRKAHITHNNTIESRGMAPDATFGERDADHDASSSYIIFPLFEGEDLSDVSYSMALSRAIEHAYFECEGEIWNGRGMRLVVLSKDRGYVPVSVQDVPTNPRSACEWALDSALGEEDPSGRIWPLEYLDVRGLGLALRPTRTGSRATCGHVEVNRHD